MIYIIVYGYITMLIYIFSILAVCCMLRQMHSQGYFDVKKIDEYEQKVLPTTLNMDEESGIMLDTEHKQILEKLRSESAANGIDFDFEDKGKIYTANDQKMNKGIL